MVVPVVLRYRIRVENSRTVTTQQCYVALFDCLLMLLRCVIEIRILYYVVRKRRSNAAVSGGEEVVRDGKGERESGGLL